MLISNEVHHINVETKSIRNKEENKEIIFWENAVNRIFKCQLTKCLAGIHCCYSIDFNNPNILNKYAERLIYDYPLKQFQIEGYSKKVKVM